MIRELSFATAGAIIAVGLVISCSDDSPGNVDAAVCDCPVLMKYEDVRQSAQPALQARAVCPANWTLVGGGCYVSGGGEDTIRLYNAGERPAAEPESYRCYWINPSNVDVTVTAWATCQSPAQ